MPPNTFPQTAITLSSLTDYDTPALLDLRPILGMLSGQSGEILGIAFTRIQQAVDNLQQTLRANSPSLQYLQIDSADIAVLAVGSQYGPGEFTVYNGGPDFAGIGWIGSRAKSTTVNITNIVAGLVTAAAAHGLKIGDNVYIEATTDANNTGFYVVATTPLTTTFTVTGGVAGGNSTGGTMTKQFQGIWSKMAAFGGTAFDNAPFQVDVDGSLSITDALISLTSVVGTTTNSIVIDPTTISFTMKMWDTVLGGSEVLIGDGDITLFRLDTAGAQDLTGSVSDIQPGYYLTTSAGLTTFTLSKVITINGYTGATGNGPVISLVQSRGTPAAASATANADILGGLNIIGSGGGMNLYVVATSAGAATSKFSIQGAAGEVAFVNDAGHLLLEGVTSTGATGTGKLVFDNSPTLATEVWVPLIVGGTTTTSTLRLRPTSGAGTTNADIIFQVGNNGATEAMRILNNGDIGIGTSTPGVQVLAGRHYLTIKGSTLGGVAELVSAQADADGNIIGLVQASDINNVTDADVRPVAIQFALDGATANRRGGSLRFLTKADSGGLTTWETLDRAGNHGFGGNTAPAYPIDATGDINTSTLFRSGGTAGLASQVVALAKLTGLGANGSITVTGGIVTAYTAPT